MTKLQTFHVLCEETTYFTVEVEALNEDEARELVHADVNSHEVISEAVSEWNIDEVRRVL
tara:strand:+ start:64 stop:243 length:180 start_codon:yes stop_codon:yes gene_type:complete